MKLTVGRRYYDTRHKPFVNKEYCQTVELGLENGVMVELSEIRASNTYEFDFVMTFNIISVEDTTYVEEEEVEEEESFSFWEIVGIVIGSLAGAFLVCCCCGVCYYAITDDDENRDNQTAMTETLPMGSTRTDAETPQGAFLAASAPPSEEVLPFISLSSVPGAPPPDYNTLFPETC